jgi:hypothetical protein
MKPPHALTDDQLKAYAEEHLQYEYEMLIWSAAILIPLVHYKDEGHLPWAFNNGLLNTFAIHARNLICFIYSSSCCSVFPTDIVLEDYVEPSIIKEHRPPISGVLQEVITKANKQVAHLTLERIEYEQGGKRWNFGEIAIQINEILAKIAPHISSGKISEQLKKKFSKPLLKIPIVNILTSNKNDDLPIGISFSLQPKL